MDGWLDKEYKKRRCHIDIIGDSKKEKISQILIIHIILNNKRLEPTYLQGYVVQSGKLLVNGHY